MYEDECVNEDEAKDLAKSINAIFQKTSAKSSVGIDDLFIKIAKKFLDVSDNTIKVNDNDKKIKKALDIKNNNKLDIANNKKLISEINALKEELSNYKKLNDKLNKEIVTLKDKLDIYQKFNEKIKGETIKLKNENTQLNNELIKANKTISSFSNIETNKKEDNSMTNEINYLKEIIKMKEKEINYLNLRLKNIGETDKKLVQFDNIIVINFTSSDQIINYYIKCLENDTFAEVEEKLYQKYEEYRNTNNNFITKGKIVLRFKKICDIGIKDGDIVQLIKIE